MMKRTTVTLTLIFILKISLAAEVNTFFKDAQSFFSMYVANGGVAYDQISNNPDGIQKLYSDIAGMNLSGASDRQKKAFYINAYNLIVIYQVTKYYPLKSPLDRSGFFDKVKHKVAGEDMTLNYLEIKKLLFQYSDARIHFVLACAAKSCPPLANFAYMPDKLDAQLEERTKLSINDKEWLQVKAQDKQVLVSKIFEWYKKDFTKDGSTLIAFINKYRSNPIPASYNVGYYEYDWALNSSN